MAGLYLVALSLSVVPTSVLVGLPLVIMVAALPVRRVVAWVAAGLAAFLTLSGGAREGLWYADRGWAILLGGWFVALTLRWPRARFTARGLGALAGAGTVAALVLGVTPGGWATLDWGMAERVRSGVGRVLEMLRLMQDEGGSVSPAMVAAFERTAEAQIHVYPAMLGLASLAALAVAWWLYARLAQGVGGGLGRMREFRFNDHLVWLFIAGLVLVVAGQGGAARAGSNALVFMGALYALRGAAVVIFLGGGLSAFGALLLTLGLILVPPVLLTGALVIGLGDTWLDIRRRIREAAA